MLETKVDTEEKAERIGAVLAHSLHQDIYKDPELIVRGYDRFKKLFPKVRAHAESLTKENSDHYEGIAVDHGSMIATHIDRVERAVKSINSGKNDYDPLEVAVSLAIIETKYIELMNVSRINI